MELKQEVGKARRGTNLPGRGNAMDKGPEVEVAQENRGCSEGQDGWNAGHRGMYSISKMQVTRQPGYGLTGGFAPSPKSNANPFFIALVIF